MQRRTVLPPPTLLRGLALALALASAAVAPAAAQEIPQPPVARLDTVVAPAGSTRSPRSAALRSLVLPGWGQAWVGSPGRGSVYFAAEAGSLWMVYRTQNRLNEARAWERFLRETGALGADEELGLVASRREQREDWITLALFTLFFSAADAYVAAQLADFDERIALQPLPGGGLAIRASLPVGRGR